MKKIVSLVFIISILLSMAACASESKITGVPNRYLETDIEEYYYQEGLDGDYSFTASHSYDEESKTDRVQIHLRISHTYADEVVTGTCTYKYDKKSETWTRVSSVRWGEMELDYKPNKYRTTFNGSWFSTNWEITVKEVNLTNNTITCQIHLTESNGRVFNSDGYCVYNLTKGYWYGFTFIAYGKTYHGYLSEDTGVYIYGEF